MPCAETVRSSHLPPKGLIECTAPSPGRRVARRTRESLSRRSILGRERLHRLATDVRCLLALKGLHFPLDGRDRLCCVEHLQDRLGNVPAVGRERDHAPSLLLE